MMKQLMPIFVLTFASFGSVLCEEESAESNNVEAFTRTEVTHSYNKQGTLRSVEYATFAQKADGASATMKRRTRADGSLIIEFAELKGDGLSTWIDYATRSKVTKSYTSRPQKLTGSCLDRIRSFSESHVESESPSESILGFEVLNVTYEASRMHFEQWIAPGLDCLPLRSIVTHLQSDGTPDGQRIVRESISVIVGEPSTQLFLVPEGFTERSPSEVVEERAKLKGLDGCGDCIRRNVEAADANYLANRPPDE